MTSDSGAEFRAWAAAASAEGATPPQVAAAVGRQLAAECGNRLDENAPALLRDASDLSPPADLQLSVWDLGIAYECALDSGIRHSQGIHYTPPMVASRLAELAIGSNVEARVCDPAVGTGAFLLGSAAHLESLGVERHAIVAEHLWGVDVDPDAVLVAEASLALWASDGDAWVQPSGNLVLGDTLQLGLGAFGDGARSFDVVVGNPPFQSQLSADTARSPERTQELRARWGVDTEPYLDNAAFFMLAGLELAAPGGQVVMIQPLSVLSAASAEPVRAELTQLADLAGIWIGDSDVFAADVQVCSPFLRKRSDRRESNAAPQELHRWEGPEVIARPPATRTPGAASWVPLVADLGGVPSVDLSHCGVLADMATATAGFRDEFYGLAEAVVDEETGDDDPKLATVGMIDPLRNRWGSQPFRLAGNAVSCPRVRLATLEEGSRLQRWVQDRLVPKVLVATQTRVIEVYVDADGEWVPCTPVIAVAAPQGRLWHVAAALSSPATSAVALGRVSGAALSAQTIKLSARQVLQLPIPEAGADWDTGAEWAREAASATDEASWRAALLEMGRAMQAAFAVDDETLFEWWESRLPRWR